jgi:hypothetical protein
MDKKGQAVFMSGNNAVSVCVAGSVIKANSIGVACYDATDSNQIAIAGPGNIVYAVCDAAEPVGTAMYGDSYGILDATAGSATKIAGIVVSLPAVVTTNYVGKVLLV